MSHTPMQTTSYTIMMCAAKNLPQSREDPVKVPRSLTLGKSSNWPIRSRRVAGECRHPAGFWGDYWVAVQFMVVLCCSQLPDAQYGGFLSFTIVFNSICPIWIFLG